jgi:hypothetical protein
MAKRVTISVDDWFYEMYFLKFSGNLSSFLRGLIVKGFDYEMAGTETTKKLIIRLNQENATLSAKIKKLEFEVAKYSHKKHKYSPETQRRLMITKGFIKAGGNADLA